MSSQTCLPAVLAGSGIQIIVGITVCCDEDSFIEELLFLTSKKKKSHKKKRIKPLGKRLFNSTMKQFKIENNTLLANVK